MKQIKTKLHMMYLVWCNDFISVSRFAEYYNVTEEKAKRIIEIGRIIHNTNLYTDFYVQGMINRGKNLGNFRSRGIDTSTKRV